MKILLNRLAVIVMLLTTVFFIGCEKAASDNPIGLEMVYLPQAIVSGGTNINYIVPSGFGNDVNFKVDLTSNKVNVLLGVSKSGKAQTKSFSVDVSTRTDTIAQLITGGATFLMLPSTAYSLPQKVTIEANQTSASFNLSIDKTILKTYAGKRVAVCVVIANPSNAAYTMSSKNRQVIIIIDVNALRLE